MELDWYQKLMLGVNARAKEVYIQLPKHCLCPGCTEAPINSHSQQAKGALSVIARGGKVVTLKRDILQSVRQGIETGRPRGQLQFQTIKQASTFKGFCAKHDTELFREIECCPLSVGDFRQALAFHRRAMAFELRNKTDMNTFVQAQFDILKPLNPYPPHWEQELQIHRILIRGDYDFMWKPLWEKNPERNIDCIWRVIDHQIGVSMASSIPAITAKQLLTYSNRHIDLVNNTIDRPRPSFSLSIIPQATNTHVVMVWNRCVAPFIGSFRDRMSSKDNTIFAEFLNQCVFCMSEDYCLGPDLWDSLSPKTKSILEEDLNPEGCCSQMIVPNIIKV